jgi:hypothetical protein
MVGCFKCKQVTWAALPTSSAGAVSDVLGATVCMYLGDVGASVFCGPSRCLC